MPHAGRALALSELRERIGRLECRGRSRKALPFGVRAVDRHLPGGGLALDALHEVMETGAASEHAAAATLFIAGILARNKGPVLWCVRRRDLFAPALAAVGLHPDRVIYAETHREAEVLAAAEEGLRHKGLAGVVAEVARLGLTASRRLQLAAEESGVPALILRRWRNDLRARFRRRGHGRRNPLACFCCPVPPPSGARRRSGALVSRARPLQRRRTPLLVVGVP